ncbi:serine/threonine-protein phosphatase [bacterium]|nr:serine/threonine-protein phosphatase [bacterium]
MRSLTARELRLLRSAAAVLVVLALGGSYHFPALASQLLFMQLAMITFFFGLRAGSLWISPTWLIYCLCVEGRLERSLFGLFCIYALLITGVTVNKFRQAKRQQLQLESALDVARQVQLSLQPPELVDFGYAQMACQIEMAKQLGGDFVCYQPCKHGHFILIGDVMGKGAQAALTAAYVKGLFDELARTLDDPKELLLILHEHLLERTVVDSFLAATCVQLDREQKCWKICRAGLPAAGVVRQDGTCNCVGDPGIMLGVPIAPQLTTCVVDYQPGDQFFLASDGLCEEEHLPSEVINALVSVSARPPEAALRHCVTMLRNCMAVGADDDKTAVLIRWN